MQGKLIVLEGIDGSGKSTQYEKLCARFDREGRAFHRIIFPRYDQESSALIRMYLSGQFGKNPADVNPYTASTFYAVDRYASFRTDWMTDYQSGGLILSDRYTTSNAVHQGSKLPDSQLPAFFDWLYEFEFQLLELPKPDLVLYMDINIETSLWQMHMRQQQTHTGGDIHETDVQYLENCIRAGRFAAEYFGWTKIRCLDGERMRSVEEIHEDIYRCVEEVL